MRPGNKHTSCHPGRRVRLVLLDGSVLEGRFVERTKNKFIILDTGKVHRRLVARFLVLQSKKAHPGE